MNQHYPAIHKLGRLPAKPARMMLRNYVDLERALPQVPDSVDNSHGQSIQLAIYLNTSIGDCTCAAVGNTLRVNSGGQQKISDQDVLDAYVAITGIEGAAYDPQTGANDNGCVELDVLDYWAKTGVGGDKLVAHAGVDMSDPTEVKTFTWLCGALYIGVNLSVAQQQQETWDYVSGSPDWGGHAVPIFDINPNRLGTWGAYKPFTDAFIAHQAEEGHALITQAWLDANKDNPLIDLDALLTDFKSLEPEE